MNTVIEIIEAGNAYAAKLSSDGMVNAQNIIAGKGSLEEINTAFAFVNAVAIDTVKLRDLLTTFDTAAKNGTMTFELWYEGFKKANVESAVIKERDNEAIAALFYHLHHADKSVFKEYYTTVVEDSLKDLESVIPAMTYMLSVLNGLKADLAAKRRAVS